MEPGEDRTPASGLGGMLEIHRAELLRFLCGRCGSMDEAQDVMQDLWIKVSAASIGPIGNPRAYLFRMANNIVLDRLRASRRAMRRERVWIEADGDGVALAPELRIDPAEPADEALSRRQEAEILQQAIARLPEGAAKALQMYRFEGMAQGEIAQILGISRSGVEKHLAVAMKHLRAVLANCGSFAAVPSHDHGADGGATPRMEQGR
ncbi:RNA polymerase sigma factor [Novosphingobium colocasiae]|uniref:RNA polymerase sigma factor n=1 Tax=Novosphingobium colocasiae TaxID=1256513 RepID=UPI0035B11FD8